jgi:hypothetical protein
MQLDKFKSIFDLLNRFPDEQSCIDYLAEIRWDGDVKSPFDPNSKVYKCKGNKYKCKATNKYFNAKTGTIFEDTKIPLQKWFLANYIFSSHKKGISSHQLARDLHVTQKTAWFMLHRLRVAFGVEPQRVSGVIESDETYIGGRGENLHRSKLKKDLRGEDIYPTKAEVMGILQREGSVIVKHITKRSQSKEYIYKYVKHESVIMTDNAAHFGMLKYHYPHHTVRHGGREYVRGDVHTNGIENFWSHLKRGINGIYHHVSVKHLQAYLDEYSLRFNTRKDTTSHRFDVILKNMTHRLRYGDLIADEKAA